MRTPELASRTLTPLIVACLLLNPLAHGETPDPWITLVKDNDRLVAEDHLGLGDTNRKDYAWGDLNLNGWIDLIVTRKQAWGIGKRRNVLFLNERGTLVDRTEQFISAAALDQLPPGVTDDGFLTPTNDAAVVLVDVMNNGWLDLVTAVTISDEDPKHIAYPRVYVNLGNDANGTWQGFLFENARIPMMLSAAGEPNHNPRFEAVAAGDVTANGYADLWFGDTDYSGAGAPPQQPNADFNDRLLVNAGGVNPGYFLDVTADSFSGLVPQINQPFPVSSSNWAVAVADLNGNGLVDLLKHSMVQQPIYIGAAYNNASNPGTFDGRSYQVIAQGAPTYFSVGDLNNNNRPDIVITDDFTDRYRLNVATAESGQVAWGPTMLLPEQPSGQFGGKSRIIDLDNTGWNDIIIADATFGVPGCNRQTNIYRNRQDAPNVTFSNESSIIPASERTGVFDVATLDITGNGWTDLVLGRCSGTDVWINVPPALPCPGDLTGDGSVGVPDLIQLLSCWGEVTPGCENADLTSSGNVGVGDLIALLGAWGACP